MTSDNQMGLTVAVVNETFSLLGLQSDQMYTRGVGRGQEAKNLS